MPFHESGASYGAFVTSGQEGAYSMTLDWASIHQVVAIEFGYGAGLELVFIAEFFDVAGHVSTQSLTLTLKCSNDWAACDGACEDTENDTQNCGTCGTACTESGCFLGQCGELDACAPITAFGTTCNDICGSKGQVCGDACGLFIANYGYSGGMIYGESNCTGYSSEVHCESPVTAAAIRCCCF